MAKEIRVSDDSGVTWHTLPGSTGDLSSEAGQLNDTIFGQTFQSTQSGVISWTITGQALYKGYAGYVATLKKVGSSTALTDEPMSLVSGKTYQVTDATKRLFNRNVALEIKDNGVAVDDADIESIDYLFGRVTFTSGYTPTGPITVASGAYFPLTAIGGGQSFTLTQTAAEIRTTTFASAQSNGGYHTHDPGLRQVTLEIQGVFDISNALRATLAARSEVVIELNPDGAGNSVARGFFKCTSHGQTGDVGALEEETVQFQLSVPVTDKLLRPFGWVHDSSTLLPTAIQKILDAWENETKLDVQYLPSGEEDTEGVEGTAIVTDCTLTGGLEAMNEFRVSFRGDGALTATA